MAGRNDQGGPAVRLGAAESAIEVAVSHKDKLAATVKAAELCMNLLSISSDPQEKKRLRQACASHLDQAERLKESPASSSEGGRVSSTAGVPFSSTSRMLQMPISSRLLPANEKIILLRGSKLHGCVFPEWTFNPTIEELASNEQDGIFVDPTVLTLSDIQKMAFDGWHRPRDLQFGSRQDELSHKVQPTMITTKSADLVQDMTSDCSVVASICVATARAEKGHPKLLESLIFPYDHVNKRPAMSTNGKYVFKMNFNGCFRRVVVDDRLPSSKTDRMLHVIDRSNPGLLWPALVEKAYLKLRGGYDFPGSNSGTDLWILSGWIPEQVFLWDNDLTVSDPWKRVYKAFNYGDVLATLGTGKLSKYEQNPMLANEHDYAIIDMKESDSGQKSFLIKNPWADGGNWQRTKDSKDNVETLAESEMNQKLHPGLFWMDSHEVFQSFKYMYLNWNPGLFTYRQDHHFTWDLQKDRSPLGSFKSNPQYVLRCREGGTCWVLLSQHFQDHVPSEPQLAQTTHGFISLYSFQGREHRTLLTERSSQRSAYVDATNLLLRTEMPAKSSQVIVVSEDTLPTRPLNFTLFMFSIKPLEVERAVERYQHETEHIGAWTFSTAGGNASSLKYKTNPQYSISLDVACDVAILLCTDTSDVLVHVKLVHTDSERVTAIRRRDIRGDSNDYRKGSALCEVQNVQPGTYAIICSTYESGQRSKFLLSIRSTAPCLVKHFPPEGAGRLVTKVPRVTFAQDMDRFLCPFQVSRTTRVRAVARQPSYLGAVKALPLRISLELGQGPEKTILAVSGDGEFLDGQREIILNDVDVLPAMCQSRGVWFVVERLGSAYVHTNGSVDVELFCDGRVEVGLWGKEL